MFSLGSLRPLFAKPGYTFSMRFRAVPVWQQHRKRQLGCSACICRSPPGLLDKPARAVGAHVGVNVPTEIMRSTNGGIYIFVHPPPAGRTVIAGRFFFSFFFSCAATDYCTVVQYYL